MPKKQSHDHFQMKINVIGTTASGKSTFGKELAAKIDVPFIEMDAVFWGANWHEPTDSEFFRDLESAMASPSWVLDGNYTRATPIKWKNVDTVIWLDYSFPRTMLQSLSRAIKRASLKTELWPNTGNYETFSRMFSKDSIVLWCLKNYAKNRKRYKKVLSNPDYSHIQFVHLRTPREAREFILSHPKADG